MQAQRLILDVLEDAPKGLCDACLLIETQLPSHQDVNGTCRNLETFGKLIRIKDSITRCSRCERILIINKLIPESEQTISRGHISPPSGRQFGIAQLDDLRRLLIQFMNRIDPDSAKVGFSKRVANLRNSDIIHSRTAALMLTHATYRNDLYYNLAYLSDSEEHILIEIDRELRAFLKDVSQESSERVN